MNIVRIVIGFFLLLSTALNAEALKVKVGAKSAILYNPENGAVLFEKEANEPHYPASILKIATAYFALDQKKLDMDALCLVNDEILKVMNAEIKQADPMLYPPHILEHDGVTMGLKEGKSYRAKDLIHGLLLISGNDAANAIATHCSGSIKQFMSELNHFLKERGIYQTHFQNPHGLHHPAQMTTAYDMAKIAGLAFSNSTLLEILRSPSFELEEGRAIKNTNRLLKEGKYNYPKFIGGKTGYTASAGYNLVAGAEDKGRRLIAVLLGAENSTKRFEDAITLFEAAFREEKKTRILFAKDHEPFFRKVKRGDHLLRAKIDRDLEISFYPSEEPNPIASLVWDTISFPIEVGQEVGRIEVRDERGNLLGEAPLISDVFIRKKPSFGWLYWMGSICLGVGTLYLLKKRGKVLKR